MSEKKAKSEALGRTISKDGLQALLQKESQSAAVFVPTLHNGDGEFTRLNGDTAADLGISRSRLSPKSFFFPQTETLYRFDFDTVEADSGEPKDQTPVVVFGVRPCDSASFALLDLVFGSTNHGYPDPYYDNRRANTTVVNLACNEPCGTCFCTSVGGDPAGTRGADVLVSDLGDRLYLTAVTSRGEELLTRNADVLKKAAKADKDAAESLAAKARESMTAVAYDKKTTKEHLDARFDGPVWEKITSSCIGCGACTYLCPTCHCFDIADEERHYKGCRIRTWDSCQYAQFTKHASGHNPRPGKTQRLRQRFMHKFSYTVETVDEVYCVGCGRCVQYCPVNLDIREVIGEFSKQ